MTCDPIIVIGPTVSIARKWAKAHIAAHERMPVCSDSLDVLIGHRGFCAIILPEAKLAAELQHYLVKNTVIDLRRM